MTNEKQTKELKQEPKAGDGVICAPEHAYKFGGTVISVDEAKRMLIVEGIRWKRNEGETEPCKQLSGTKEQREFHWHEVEAINGRYVFSRLMHYNGTHPMTPLLVEVGTKQQLEGRDQAAILWQSLTFMSTEATHAHQKLISAHLKVIRNAADELVREEEHLQLWKMGILLLKLSTDTAQRKLDREAKRKPDDGFDSLDGFFARDHALRLKLLQMSHDELRKIFNEEGLKLLPPK